MSDKIKLRQMAEAREYCEKTGKHILAWEQGWFIDLLILDGTELFSLISRQYINEGNFIGWLPVPEVEAP